jgi:hypothetical protein
MLFIAIPASGQGCEEEWWDMTGVGFAGMLVGTRSNDGNVGQDLERVFQRVCLLDAISI